MSTSLETFSSDTGVGVAVVPEELLPEGNLMSYVTSEFGVSLRDHISC